MASPKATRDTITIADAGEWLRWFLDAVYRGELTASAGTTARLEGAVAALQALVELTPAHPRPGAVWGASPGRKRDAVLQARDGLGQILEAICEGELSASSVYVAGLEGAIAVMDVLLERP